MCSQYNILQNPTGFKSQIYFNMQVADRCVVGPIEKDQQGDKQADQQITHRDLQIFAALSPGSPDSANTPHLSDVAPPAPPSASKPTINKPFFLRISISLLPPYT
jgi:hypothetical protein